MVIVGVMLLVMELMSFFASNHHATARGLQPCSSVIKECTSAMDCGAALHSFEIVCTYGDSDACSDLCLRMSVQLYTILRHVHSSLGSCDCQGSDHCKLRQEKMHSGCIVSVTAALEDRSASSVALSCRLARIMCEADSKCREALDMTITLCPVSVPDCSGSCGHALGLLTRSNRAEYLIGCTCDTPDTGCTVNRMRSVCPIYRSSTYSTGGSYRGQSSPLVGFLLVVLLALS